MLSQLVAFNRLADTVFKKVKDASEYATFCSWKGRFACLNLAALYGVGGIFMGPFITPSYACKQNTSFRWKVLDITACILLTPLLAAIFLIKALVGTILHPGIIFSSDSSNMRRNEPRFVTTNNYDSPYDIDSQD